MPRCGRAREAVAKESAPEEEHPGGCSELGAVKGAVNAAACRIRSLPYLPAASDTKQPYYDLVWCLNCMCSKLRVPSVDSQRRHELQYKLLI